MNNEKMMSFLSALPLGYMTCVKSDLVPEGFIEVDGQRLNKHDNLKLFNVLQGNVIDEGETFLLPQRAKLAPMFNNFDSNTSKIVLKIR